MEENITPMISVVVPIYNVEKYVRESIESILDQTFVDFELIIVDDASPDGSLEICQNLAQYDTRIKIIRHTYNQGLGAARNTGMYQSRGRYIAFLDSDDLMIPTALETFYNAATKNNAEVVHCSHFMERTELPDGTFDPNYKKCGDKTLLTGMLYADRNKRLMDRYKDFQEWMMVWLNFYRRDFLMKNALKNPRMLAEDNAFHIALLCLTDRYFYIDEALHIYSRRPGSIIKSITRETSVKWAASAVEGVKYIDEIMSRLPEKILSKSTRTQIVCKLMSDLMRRAVFDFYKSKDVFDGEVLNIFLQALRPYFDQNIRLAAYFLQNYAANRLWHNDQVAKLNAQRKTSDALKKTNAALQKTNDSLKKSNAALNAEKNFCARPKIIFMNFFGKGFGCNPKYIALEIIRRKLPYDLVWLVSDMNEPMPAEIRKVRFGSPEAEHELATAKVFVTNIKNSPPYKKRDGQYLIMTWHGGISVGAFKKVEREAEAQLSPRYVAQSKANSKMTDLMLSASKRSTEEIRKNFWYDGEIMECGVPNNDILFNRPPDLIDKVKVQLGIPSTNKILMYGPTFRNKPEDNLSACRLDFNQMLEVVAKKFGGEWTLVMRLHPNVASLNLTTRLVTLSDRIVDATKYADTQELLVAADVLVSDYSGIMISFLAMRKPVFICAKDLDTYPKERGLKPFYFELPIEHNKTEAELFDCIAKYDEPTERARVDEFMSKIKSFDDGHASEHVVDRIVEVIDGKASPEKRRGYVRDLYCDEVRDGFFVDVARKKMWNVQIELILEVDRICRKHGLKWFALYGTLLGAARHKGFVPWDDDVDLVMLRPDYDRFIEIASDELNKNYSLDIWYNYACSGEPNPENFPVIKPPGVAFLKIRDNNSIRCSLPVKRTDLNYGICIDIFPFDPVPIALDGKNDLIWRKAHELHQVVFKPDSISKLLKSNSATLNPTDELSRLIKLPFKQRALEYEKFLAESYVESKYVSYIPFYASHLQKVNTVYKSPAFEFDWFRDVCELPFEKITVPAPIEYERVLTARYGDWHKMIVTHSHVNFYSSDISSKEFFSSVHDAAPPPCVLGRFFRHLMKFSRRSIRRVARYKNIGRRLSICAKNIPPISRRCQSISRKIFQRRKFSGGVGCRAKKKLRR